MFESREKIVVEPEEFAALQMFKTEVADREREIDAEDELDWMSLSVGYFLAKGLEPHRAYELSVVLRYKLEYFTDTSVNIEMKSK